MVPCSLTVIEVIGPVEKGEMFFVAPFSVHGGFGGPTLLAVVPSRRNNLAAL